MKTAMLAAVPRTKGFVGMTVMPEDFQVEGIDNVLGALRKRAGVTAVATAPYVMARLPMRSMGFVSHRSMRARERSGCSTGRFGASANFT